VGGDWDGVSSLVAYVTGLNALTQNPGASILPNAGAFTLHSCSAVQARLPV
jgi:hypothetical protein